MKRPRVRPSQVGVLVILWFWVGTPSLLPAGEIVLRGEDQMRFAHALMERGEYERAAAEFERFLHFFPDDPYVPQANQLMGVCLMEAGRFEKARAVFLEIVEKAPDSPVGVGCLFLMGESYYRQGVPGEAAYYFLKLVQEHPDSELKDAALYRMGWSELYSDQWTRASEWFHRVDKKSPFSLNADALAKESVHGEALPYKNPSYAGVMAAGLPGLGHAYVGRYRDALVAFIINGLFIWAAVEAFDEDHDVLGAMLVFAEVGWYTGNIYSAVNATHKHNQRLKDDFRRGLEDRLSLGLLMTRQGDFGLRLNVRF
jgi:tetratricopeptide (TPR) repeat protein